MPLLIEKDKSISTDILRLFERTRVAYLSARTDPKEYGSKWRNAVNKIKDAYEMSDALSNELKDYIPLQKLCFGEYDPALSILL